MHISNFINYIDPGTGSMLLTVILSLVTAGVFVARGVIIKMKTRLSGGRIAEDKDKLPYVIYSDHKRYWNVFEPVCDEFERRGLECRYLTGSHDDPALTKEYEHVTCEFIGEGNKGFARLNMMKAYICLSTTPGLDVLQWKRSRDVSWYAHIFHDTGDGLLYRMFGLDYYDAILATGTLQEPGIRKLESLRDLPAKEVYMVGSTYMDRMYEKSQSYRKDDDPEKPVTVLLAPSWGDSAILKRFGADLIGNLVNTGYRIIIRPHPQSKISEKEVLDALEKQFPANDMLSWNYDNDNFKVLSEADIMISDFSGVIFDYIFTFDRPIIYADTEFDYAPYDAAWIEEGSWSLRALPDLGPKLEQKDFPNIKAIIDSTITSEAYKANRAKHKDLVWQCRGEAAKRTVDCLTAKYKELKKAETQGAAK